MSCAIIAILILILLAQLFLCWIWLRSIEQILMAIAVKCFQFTNAVRILQIKNPEKTDEVIN